jgi:hypothetical protein
VSFTGRAGELTAEGRVLAALEGDDPWEVLAAAELVAAAAGQPALDLPPDVLAWVEANAAQTGELIDLAREAVTRATRSEEGLRPLWTEGDEAPWTLRLADLERRLGVR